MRIHEMPLESRPRERMQKLGVHMLSDAELLAVVLQKGTRGENIIDISHRLLSLYGAKHLSKLSLKELQKIKGIGPAKAMQISALMEFAKRHSAAMRNGKPLRSAKDVFLYASPRIRHADKEMFMVLHLDAKNKVVKEEVVSVGILDASLIHPREVFKSAIKESSRAVIFVHNHPSGDPAPSAEDEAITRVLKEAGELLDIPVLDHVIIGAGKWYSFKEGKVL
jgi:DNA repair protein RadC